MSCAANQLLVYLRPPLFFRTCVPVSSNTSFFSFPGSLQRILPFSLFSTKQQTPQFCTPVAAITFSTMAMSAVASAQPTGAAIASGQVGRKFSAGKDARVSTKVNAKSCSRNGAAAGVVTRDQGGRKAVSDAYRGQVRCALAEEVHTRDQDDIRAYKGFERPDSFGRYGVYGGKYVPETLMAALTNLEVAYRATIKDPEFQKELNAILKDYVGRETPLYFAERLTEHYKRDGKGPEIYLKREDLNHTGAHKINNAIAQALLAKRIGKKRIIAETGAGQHGVATATVCARFGLECIVYMGAQDMERQALNVFRMRLLGAEVRSVTSGTATLKDATSEAIRDWVTNVETTHYILGSVAGPHPYPMIVRDFHAMIGTEVRRQAMEKWGGKPDVLLACVGGGSNAMGLFHEFVEDEDVRLIGVEAAGFGTHTDKHAATLTMGEIGVLHGAMSYLLQDADGQIIEPHSISAGLDYPGVGPEHSFLKDVGRAEYFSVTDDEALEAFQRLSKLEGIIPALETSHALAFLEELCPTLADGTRVVLNCSGRGDKDVNSVIGYLKGKY